MHRRAVQVGVLVGLLVGALVLIPAGRTNDTAATASPPAVHNVFGAGITLATARNGLVLALACGLIAYLVVRAARVGRELSSRSR